MNPLEPCRFCKHEPGVCEWCRGPKVEYCIEGKHLCHSCIVGARASTYA